MHSTVLTEKLYIFQYQQNTVLIKMHFPLNPLLSHEFFIFEWGKEGYRSCSADYIYLKQNIIPYIKKNNFIKTKFQSQLCMIFS